MAEAVCKIDRVPLSIHLACWACQVLVGPRHAAPRLAGWGLCPSCWPRFEKFADLVIAREKGGEPDTDRLLTAAEVAEHFRVTARTVRQWTSCGRLKAVPSPGGQFLYRADDLPSKPPTPRLLRAKNDHDRTSSSHSA